MKDSRNKISIDFHLLGLFCALAVLNVPIFTGRTLPFIDTFYVFQQFYYTYNELFTADQFPLWMPFASYGQQFNVHLLSSMSPAGYITGLAGLIFHVRDVMLLFNISLFLEQAVLLYGTYLLSKSLFRHKATVAFVCIVVIASGTILQHNIYFNFRIFYILPLVVYLVNSGFVHRKLSYFAAAMLVFGIQGIGLVPYMMVLPLLFIVVITATMAYINRRDLGSLIRPARSDIVITVAVLLFVVLLAGSLLQLVEGGRDTLSIMSPGRSEDGRQTLESFLTYGGEVGTSKFVDVAFPKYTALGPADNDHVLNNIFIFAGILPLFFTGYLIATKKTPPLAMAMLVAVFVLALFSIGKTGTNSLVYHLLFAAILITHYFVNKSRIDRLTKLLLFTAASILVAVSVAGSNVATVFYYVFPGMSYYRHIGYSVNLFKILLPFVAGFGLDYYLESLRTGDTQTHRLSHINLARLLFAATAALYIGAYIYHIEELPSWANDVGRTSKAFLLIFAALLAAGIYLLRRWGGKKSYVFFASAVVFIAVFEMISLRVLVDASYSNLSKQASVKNEATEVYEYAFHNERTDVPVSAHARKGMALKFALHPYGPAMMNNQLYWSMCSYSIDITNYDSPWYLTPDGTGLFNMRVDTMNSYLNKLVSSSTGNMNTFFYGSCASPKLSLVSDVVLTGDVSEAIERIGGLRSKVMDFAQDKWSNHARRILPRGYRESRTVPETEETIKALLDNKVMISDLSPEIMSRWQSQESRSDKGRVRVLDFSTNHLEAEVELPEGAASWLYYTDSWHPKWKAYVNGAPAHIAKANIAFKAVMLNGGVSRVLFAFEDEPGKYSVYLIAAFGVAFMVMVIAGTLRSLLVSRQKNTL